MKTMITSIVFAFSALVMPAMADDCDVKSKTVSAQKDIVDAAVSAGSFNTLAAAGRRERP
jgi:hypothetical protein